MDTIERLESEVRSYCRAWPTTFATATGSTLQSTDGRTYTDFFSGAGALNYGHNDPKMTAALIDYVAGGGILHGLDMATEAKEQFLETFDRLILQPRGLDYRIQFPGPTGTNSVEAALKLARKLTGRDSIAGFTNGFHGMTLGSLAVTGNGTKRSGAGVPLGNSVALPFEGFFGEDVDTISQIRQTIEETSSGTDRPAAIIVETVQAEGGVNTASARWLRALRALCDDLGMLLILDDIQAGCGRTGAFFSFEEAGIVPDIVCLSKSISGCGLPMALTLIKPDHDLWLPGEHNGTFRGNNAAFVTARVALEQFWVDDQLEKSTRARGELVERRLADLAQARPDVFEPVRGRGLIRGLPCRDPETSSAVARRAFERGLLIETSGPAGEVVKPLPPLTTPDDVFEQGLDMLCDAVDHVIAGHARQPADALAGVAS